MPYAFEQYFAYRFYRALAWSPDGRELAYVTNASGQYNLWKQPADGGWPTQLTDFHDEAIHTLAWRGNKIVFTADRDGDEFKQVYVMADGWPRQLTNRPQVRLDMGDEAISPDGRRAFYSCNARNPASSDLCAIDLATGKEEQLTVQDQILHPVAWSPDGKRLLTFWHRTNSESDAMIWENGDLVNVSKSPPETACWPVSWAPDGKSFYALSNLGREFTGLTLFEGPKMRWVETPEWDVVTATVSPDGRRLAWVVNEDAVHRLHVRDLASGEELPLPPIPDGIVADIYCPDIYFSPDGRRIAFFLNSYRHPKDLYVLHIDERRLQRLTVGFIGGIPESDLCVPEQIRYAGPDGRKIPAWVFKPKGAKKAPAVLWIHGGPEWQIQAMWLPVAQYLASRGFVVVAPNIRGSTGYGKTYQRSLYRDWGGGDLADIKAAAEFMRAMPEVDPARMAVYGGSYGGFASLSAATRLPEFWRAAVDVFGVSNLVTFAKSVPPTWRGFVDKAIGNPEKDFDWLMARSPITHIDNVKCPMLVIQGAHDPRVVKAESDQVVEKLRARGAKVDYHVFDDEGHGFSRRKNEVKAYRLICEFLERELTRP